MTQIKNNKRMLGALLLLFSLQITGQNKEYQIDGKIKGIPDGQLIMLFTFNVDTIYSVDTTRVENGTFHFTGVEDLRQEAIITTGNYPDIVKSVKLLLERGTTSVDMDATPAVSGTPINELLIEYKNYFNLDTEKHQGIEAKFKAGEIDEQERNRAQQERSKEYRSKNNDFIIKNINNIVGKIAFLEADYLPYSQRFDEIYALLDDEFKSDPRVIENIKEFKEEKEIEARRAMSVGKKYQDFEFQTPNGERVRLSDYVGKSKYIFLDFWASWCGPCIEDVPYIKEIYNTYKDKGLEVISISIDNSRDSWLRGLKRIDTPWIHLLDLDYPALKEAYNIIGIPYGILLNEDGVIIEVNLRGAFLKYYMQQLFPN